MKSRKSIALTETIVIGFFSFIAYLFLVAQELGYLQYFHIPSSFLHLNIFESENNFLLIIGFLIFTYLLYFWMFRNLYYYRLKIFRSQKIKKIKRLYYILIITVSPLILPFMASILLKVWDVFQINFFIALTTQQIIYFLQWGIESSYPQINPRLINNLFFHFSWVVSSFMCFWFAGYSSARNQEWFNSIDNGKNAIVYISDNKLFLRPIKNDTLLERNEFELASLLDSNYHFKLIAVKRKFTIQPTSHYRHQ